MLELRHGRMLVMALLHIAKADIDAVCYGAVPNLRVGRRQQPNNPLYQKLTL